MPFNLFSKNEKIVKQEFSPFSANFPEGCTFRVGDPTTKLEAESVAKQIDAFVKLGYLDVDRMISLVERFDSKVELLDFITVTSDLIVLCSQLEEKGLLLHEVDSVKSNLGLVDTSFLFQNLQDSYQRINRKNVGS